MKNNIYSTCVSCHSNTENFVRVCIQDHLQILKKRMKELMKYNPYSCVHMCEYCVMKLRIFIKCDSNVYLPNMQEPSNSNEDIIKNFKDTNCQCNHCKEKYGNLPLLAEVIEKFENKDNSGKLEENLTKRDDEQKSCVQNEAMLVDEEDTSQPSTSNNKKVLKCEHCDKTFTHKGDYNKHLRKHTGEQPFKCTVCSRKFAHTSNLARHLRVHSGVKPFRCERCNKSFSRKDKLLIHQKTRLCLNSAARN